MLILIVNINIFLYHSHALILIVNINIFLYKIPCLVKRMVNVVHRSSFYPKFRHLGEGGLDFTKPYTCTKNRRWPDDE